MNTRRTIVRKGLRPGTPTPAPRANSRAERTRHALGTALIELMHEQPLQDISVQAVLDRAGIGRATFYAHYRNKRDLFLSENERFLGFLETQLDAPGARPGRLVPVTEFFAHVASQGAYLRALRESGELELIYRLVTGEVADMIERRLAVLSPPAPGAVLAPSAEAQFAAGALVEVLRWWLGRDDRPTPAEMDEAWHVMAWRALRDRRSAHAGSAARQSMTGT